MPFIPTQRPTDANPKQRAENLGDLFSEGKRAIKALYDKDEWNNNENAQLAASLTAAFAPMGFSKKEIPIQRALPKTGFTPRLLYKLNEAKTNDAPIPKTTTSSDINKMAHDNVDYYPNKHVFKVVKENPSATRGVVEDMLAYSGEPISSYTKDLNILFPEQTEALEILPSKYHDLNHYSNSYRGLPEKDIVNKSTLKYHTKLKNPKYQWVADSVATQIPRYMAKYGIPEKQIEVTYNPRQGTHLIRTGKNTSKININVKDLGENIIPDNLYTLMRHEVKHHIPTGGL